jgi:hypothetical protein
MLLELMGSPMVQFQGSWKQMKEVIIVDPLEAKRLAAEEWNLLQARAALQVFLTVSVWLLLTCIFAPEHLQFHYSEKRFLPFECADGACWLSLLNEVIACLFSSSAPHVQIPTLRFPNPAVQLLKD